MQQPNLLPLLQFINQVKAADLSQQKEIRLDLKSAKIIAYSIAELNMLVNTGFASILANLPTQPTVTEVKLDGGGFTT